MAADKLTPQQAQAVFNRGGNLLVSAAAGSGKTKVLVDRLMCYLTDEQDPANLDEFLIITYTKAAATELRGKIAKKLTERIAQEPENRHLQKQMQRLFLTKISTVHGFCGDLLREYAYRLDIAPDFRVADENECAELRQSVMSELLDQAYSNAAENQDFCAFVDTQGMGRTDSLVPEIIERVFDSAQCHMDPEGWLQFCLDAVDLSDVEDAAETIWGAYLLEDLFQYLDRQIQVMEKCVESAENCPGFEKPAVTLRDTLFQLQELRKCTTWDAVVAKGNIDYGRLTFPRKNPDPELAEGIKAARTACKKGMEKKLRCFADPSEQVLADLDQSAAGTRGLISLVHQFGERYRQVKRSRRVLDFSDLEHRTLDLLRGKKRSAVTATAVEIGRRFREIMVDEYQDSNAVQDAIFSALTQERQNCFMVGDVKQSIYQFRLADPGIFLEKYHTYVPADQAKTGEGRKVLLSHNFRSGMEILDGANAVFYKCMTPEVGGLAYGEAEALREGVPHVPLDESGIELYVLETEVETHQEEASFVAQKIQQMLREGTLIRDGENMRSVTPEDIVILLRSPGSIGKYYQQALEKRGIRCASGAGDDLLQTQEIGTLRSFLQTIVNPRQDIPLLSTLASPIFGFTADDLAAIRSVNKYGSIYDALVQCDLPRAKDFLHTLSILRREARTSTLTQLLEQCFTLTRLDSIYAAMDGGEAKRENLQLFYQMACDFESGSVRDMGQFLEHLDAMEGKGLIHTQSGNSGCVNIMSIHKSKGLEFPVVFLSGLSRSFNRDSLKAQILCDRKLGLGMSVADSGKRIRYPSISKYAIMAKTAAESLSEEMRILYVAMTRARDRLIMTYASKSLVGDLENIARRMDFDNGRLICMDASSPGKWVLLTALGRMEAGELHALGGRPLNAEINDYPWEIRVAQSEKEVISEKSERINRGQLPEGAEKRIRESLGFSYPYISATQAPSKQTATGRKGRQKDAEAAENTQEPKNVVRTWRTPSFITQRMEGKAYGNAIHAAMQYIRYENCENEETISQEINRLTEEGFLKPDQAALVNCQKLAVFFATEIGRKLISGMSCLREFKFSILDDGNHYGENLDGEQVLLQGVVDCALLEADGITILDFKTDYVTEETLLSVTDRYRLQIETYAEALSRIYEMPVKQKLLYFFRLDRFVNV